MVLESILFIISGTMTALVAGLLYAFLVAINGALHRLRDSEYVGAMQSINLVILNPVFLLTFIAPVFLLPLTAYLYLATSPTRFALLALAAILYIVATFGVTIRGNVPLNERLARFELSGASSEDVTRARSSFEQPWNRLHAIRTAASIAATGLVLAAGVFS